MIFLFALVLLLALAMIPVGLPGTWVMVVAAVALGFASTAVHVGWLVIAGSFAGALVAEVTGGAALLSGRGRAARARAAIFRA